MHCFLPLTHSHFPFSNRLGHKFIDLGSALPSEDNVEGLTIWKIKGIMLISGNNLSIQLVMHRGIRTHTYLWPPLGGKPSRALWLGWAFVCPPGQQCYSYFGISTASYHLVSAKGPTGLPATLPEHLDNEYKWQFIAIIYQNNALISAVPILHKLKQQ